MKCIKESEGKIHKIAQSNKQKARQTTEINTSTADLVIRINCVTSQKL